MPMVYIETYGCAANQSDSEIMAGLLARAGFQIVSNIEDADIVILNTCVVKRATENRMYERIKELNKKYSERLIIAGCMPVSEYERVKEITSASLIGPRSVSKIVGVVSKVIQGKHIEEFDEGEDKICLTKISKNKIIDIVQIAEGCASACSFCLTKYARGNLHSYPIEKIVKEISEAKAAGFKEFWLTAQDCGCYGFDIDSSLPELINKITKEVKGKYLLRLGMINPKHAKKILPELIECYKNEHVFKFLHIPVQSGSDRILKLMLRGYSVEDFVNIISEFRKEIPDITIWTDIIVGFPTETEDDFKASLKLLEEIQPDFTNISGYSLMPGTKAATLPQLSTEIKKERTRKISEVVERIIMEKNKRWLGWTGEVLIDEYNYNKGNFIGRNYAYKPIILKERLRIGEFVKVKITDAKKTGLIGSIT